MDSLWSSGLELTSSSFWVVVPIQLSKYVYSLCFTHLHLCLPYRSQRLIFGTVELLNEAQHE